MAPKVEIVLIDPRRILVPMVLQGLLRAALVPMALRDGSVPAGLAMLGLMAVRVLKAGTGVLSE